MAALTPGLHRRGSREPGERGGARRDAPRRRRITMEDFNARSSGSSRASRRRTGSSTRRSARSSRYHEMGHALVARRSRACDPVHKVSIIPRGIGALGYTIQRPTEDRFLMTREELENKMAVLLGGRAAEHVVLRPPLDRRGGRPRQGHRHRAQHGDALRHGRRGSARSAYETEPDGFLGVRGGRRRLYAEETAREIDVAVREIVKAAYEKAARRFSRARTRARRATRAVGEGDARRSRA